MHRHWSKKEIRQFLEQYPFSSAILSKKSLVVESDEGLLIDGSLCFQRAGDRWVPSLAVLREHDFLPVVVVDKGAPPFLAKGADVMRPGVVRCEGSFSAGDLVVIVDETHHFPLATGEALCSSEELFRVPSGKVVRLLFNLVSKK